MFPQAGAGEIYLSVCLSVFVSPVQLSSHHVPHSSLNPQQHSSPV